MRIPENRKQELKRADLNYQKELKGREKKLKEIDHLYKQKYKEIKSDSREKLESFKINQRNREVKEIEQENKKWQHVQNRLHEKKALWEKELDFIKAKYKGELNIAREKKIDTLDRQNTEFLDYQNDLDKRGNQAVRELKETNRENLAIENLKSKNEALYLKDHNESLEDQAIRSYSHFNQKQRRDIASAIRRKERMQKDRLKDLQDRNTSEIKMRQELQKTNVDNLNETHNETLREREEILKDKITTMEIEHQKALDRIKAKNLNDINDLKKGYTKRKDEIDNKSKDPFYKLNSLKPKIKEKKNEYHFSLNIPEHESRAVILSGKGKKLRLTSTRNFEDLAKAEDGTINRSARSEMISEEFLVDSNIKPRGITRHYEDGQLIFKVPKY